MYTCREYSDVRVVGEVSGTRTRIGESFHYYSDLQVVALALPAGADLQIGDIIELERKRNQRIRIVVGEMECNGMRIKKATGPCNVGVRVGRWIRWGTHPVYRIDPRLEH